MQDLPLPRPHRPRPQRRGVPLWLRALGLVSTVLLLALGVAQAQERGDPPGRVGRVVWVDGDAQLIRADGSPVIEQRRDGLRNWPLTQGDRVRLEVDSRAELAIGSTRLRLGEDSELVFTRLDDERIDLELVQGSLALLLRSDELAREVRIDTPDGRLYPEGAGLFRIDVPAPRRGEPEPSAVTAWRNALVIDQSAGRQSLRPGQRAELFRDGGWRLTTPMADSFARWAMKSEDLRPLASRDDPVPDEMTGADELERHGSWTRSGDYGWVWFPDRVGADWAPYRDGRWVWVAPWGWTWVDAAPWGFAPFHYGRWVWWRERWGWVPGDWIARPAWAPALVVWSGQPGLNWSVSIGSGVAWYPLAPREVYVPPYRVGPRYVQFVNRPHVHDRVLLGRAAERPDEVLGRTDFRYARFAPAISIGDGRGGERREFRTQPWRGDLGRPLPVRPRGPDGPAGLPPGGAIIVPNSPALPPLPGRGDGRGDGRWDGRRDDRREDRRDDRRDFRPDMRDHGDPGRAAGVIVSPALPPGNPPTGPAAGAVGGGGRNDRPDRPDRPDRGDRGERGADRIQGGGNNGGAPILRVERPVAPPPPATPPAPVFSAPAPMPTPTPAAPQIRPDRGGEVRNPVVAPPPAMERRDAGPRPGFGRNEGGQEAPRARVEPERRDGGPGRGGGGSGGGGGGRDDDRRRGPDGR